MAGSRRRSHAVHTREEDLPAGRPHPAGAPDGHPYTPLPGDAGWIRTLLYASHDPAEWRPFVVIETPTTAHGYIVIATRTSDPNVAGVTHPADPDLTFGKDGVFSDRHLVKQQDWTSHHVRYQAPLSQALLTEVKEWFA